jgi:outer membrane protein TolC
MNLLNRALLGVLLLACVEVRGTSQSFTSAGTLSSALPESPAPTASTVAGLSVGGQATAGSGAPTQAITLEEAIRRAQTIDHTYLSAWVDRGTAEAGRTIARSAVLPNVDYHNQALYTEPQRPYSAASGTDHTVATSPAPIFIANNSVREYVSQGLLTETIGVGRIADLRRADAEAAAAKARLEIARRGLVATVVGAYYGVLAAEEKARVAQEALDEATRFSTITQQLENGGEAAHVDSLKADLQQAQRQRDQQDATLAAEKARLDLGILLFPDPAVPYTLSADLDHLPVLATREELAAAAKTNNADIRAALASLHAAQLGVTSSISAYLPDLSVAYTYGIDADHFAVYGPDGVRNLGYSIGGTLDIPVWDWFATAAKVKQSRLTRDLAKADLTAAQRRALAQFQEFFGEAQVANQQLVSLTRDMTTAREALRLTTLRYSNGEGTVLEVVDAQNTLVGAETARADGVIRYYTALADLQTLTGSLP